MSLTTTASDITVKCVNSDNLSIFILPVLNCSPEKGNDGNWLLNIQFLYYNIIFKIYIVEWHCRNGVKLKTILFLHVPLSFPQKRYRN